MATESLTREEVFEAIASAYGDGSIELNLDPDYQMREEAVEATDERPWGARLIVNADTLATYIVGETSNVLDDLENGIETDPRTALATLIHNLTGAYHDLSRVIMALGNLLEEQPEAWCSMSDGDLKPFQMPPVAILLNLPVSTAIDAAKKLLTEQGYTVVEQGFWPMMQVSREDFKMLGFDVTTLTDEQMREVAGSFESDSVMTDYWETLQSEAKRLGLIKVGPNTTGGGDPDDEDDEKIICCICGQPVMNRMVAEIIHEVDGITCETCEHVAHEACADLSAGEEFFCSDCENVF